MRLSVLVFPRSHRGDPVPWAGPAYRLIRAVVAANPRTVVVLISGSAILKEAWEGAIDEGGVPDGRAA